MESFGAGYRMVTLPAIQQTIAQWVLELAELSEIFDREGELPPEQYYLLLHRTLVLLVLLEDALIKRFPDRQFVDAVNALILYRISKDEYVRAGHPHKVVAEFFNSSTRETKRKEYSDYMSFVKDKDVMAKREFILQSVDILPDDELLKLIARAITITARDYGVLAFQVQPKPSHRVLNLSEEEKEVEGNELGG